MIAVSCGALKSASHLLILVKVKQIGLTESRCITMVLNRQELEKGDYEKAVSTITHTAQSHFKKETLVQEIPEQEFEFHYRKAMAHF